MMQNQKNLTNTLIAYKHIFHAVVPFQKDKDKLLMMDFSEKNTTLTPEIFHNTELFSNYINQKLQDKKALYGIGGYEEVRKIYSRSNLFDTSKNEEPRTLHLGIDIWGKPATPVFAPLGGAVHSFKFNDGFGDYGATIILQHQLDAMTFYTLYGHVSMADLGSIRQGQFISAGETFAHFGEPKENGHWPPHLHFQIIHEMHQLKGDYPGVCKISESGKYLSNSPDANIILQMMEYAADD